MRMARERKASIGEEERLMREKEETVDCNGWG